MSRTSLFESASKRLLPLASAASMAWVAMAWVALLAGGCSTTLEDGYKPRTLDAGADARKSFYASPFSENAQAGDKENGPSLRPGH